MNQFVKDNAAWVNKYDSRIEAKKIKNLVNQLGLSYQGKLRIADVGCGNGRSSRCIQEVFRFASIDAVDINLDCIKFALESQPNNINYVCGNAFDFFASPMTKYSKYDLVFFIWSLFDIVSGLSRVDKNIKLDLLLSQVSNRISENGHVIILQPTKGGDFEKLLSVFMPDSEEDYLFIHEYLVNKGFNGPKTPFPPIDDPDAIWSNFVCNQEELFSGVSSILMLEANQILTKEKFNDAFEEFVLTHSTEKKDCFCLSDCVNLYYI